MPDDAIERARRAVDDATGGRFKTLGDFTEALLSEEDSVAQDALIGEAATLLHHFAASASQQAPEGRATLHSVWLQAELNHRTYSDTGDRERDIQFLTLGLTGEAGEVANFVKKRWRDGVGHDDDIRKEIADVCAYAFMLANTMGMTPGDLMQVIADKQAVFVAKMQARPAMLDAAPSVILGEVG